MASYTFQYTDWHDRLVVGHLDAASDFEAVEKAFAVVRRAENKFKKQHELRYRRRRFKLHIVSQDSPHRLVYPDERADEPF